MSFAVGQIALWSDIKKLYTDAYDTGNTYQGHRNYLFWYGPAKASTATYPREDSSWGAGQIIYPVHVNRIINAHNNRASILNYRKAYNHGTSTTVATVSTNNYIKATDLSYLRTYFNNALAYNPCNDDNDDRDDYVCDRCDDYSCK